MPDKITNPHDKFVKETFSHPKRAAAFFEKFLPEEVRSELDFSTLQVANESYIQSDLSQYLSDIVFHVNTIGEEPIDLALLFEHKSNPDKYTLIQVGHYLFSHWIKCRERNAPVRPIIPVIYYQGKEKWHVPQLGKLFPGLPSTLGEYIPTLRHIFIALNTLSDEAILNLKISALAAALLTQKRRFDPFTLAEELKKIFSLLAQSREDRNFIIMFGVYIISVAKTPPSMIIDAMEDISTDIKNDSMTTYDQLIEKGKKEGIKEGKIEGIKAGLKEGIKTGRMEGIKAGLKEGQYKEKVAVILSGLDKGLDIAILSSLTKLDEVEVLEILRKNGKI